MEKHTGSVSFAARVEKRRRLLAQGALAEGGDAAAMKERASRLLDLLEGDDDALATAPSPPEPTEELAALSGRFSPDDVLALCGVADADRLTVLTRLTSICTVETVESGTRWLLRADRRVIVLNQLIVSGELAQRLQAPLPATDRPGLFLRAVLKGEWPVAESLDMEGLQALHWALEALAGVTLPTPGASEVQQVIAKRQFLAEHDVLLQNGFTGRDEELGQLHAFLREPVRTLLLTGLGGAGKSTLLAKFARQVVDERLAIAALIDFDQPGIDGGDLATLEVSIARQVAVQVPEAAAELRDAEARLDLLPPTQRYSRMGSDASAQEAMEVEQSTVLAPLGALLEEHAPSLPLLLILDTFEEVVQRNLTWRLVNWAQGVPAPVPGGVKVIISGRLFEDGRKTVEDAADRSVAVAEFSPNDAAAFLELQDVAEPVARRLANSDVLPRRPLELKLLARWVCDNPAASIEELEDDIRKGGPAARGLFAGLVYRRVLRRLAADSDTYAWAGVTTEMVRTLAYPGLILRYITPEIVRGVLAPALGIGRITELQAYWALRALASHHWLASENGDKVWHRRDLRRSVLKPMIAEDPERARGLHRAAIAYFDQAADSDGRAEGYYHRLMLLTEPCEPDFDLDVLRKAAPVFQADAPDLPLPGAALLDFATRGTVDLERFKLLAPGVRGAAYDQLGTSLVNSREFSSAWRLYADSERPLAEWERILLYATGDWNRLDARLPRYPNIGNLLDLGWFLLPKAVAGSIPRMQLLSLLTGVTTREQFSGPGVATPLQWLSIGLALALEGASLPSHVIEAVARWWRHTDRIAFDEPVLRKALIVPQLLSNTPVPSIPISSSTILLDQSWLADVRARIPFESVLEIVQQQLQRPAPTVRSLLRAVNATGSMLAPIQHQPELLVPYLEFPRPEFRDPARYALLDAFSDPASHRELGACFQQAISLAIDDLQPDAFAKTIGGSPEHALESYVELADRAGVLPQLLRAALERRPNNAKLLSVSAVIERWRQAVRNAVRFAK